MASFEWERGHQEEKAELIRTAPMLAGKEQLTAFVLLLLEQGTLDSLVGDPRELRQLELAAQGGAVCVVTCARQPDEATLEDLRRAVCRLRGLDRVVLQVKIDPAILGGFRLEVQGVVYDRSVRGRLERLAQGLQGDFDADSEELEGLVEGLKSKIQGFEVEDGSDMGSLVQNLKTRIQDFQSVGEVQEIGRIISVGDGIAQIQGLTGRCTANWWSLRPVFRAWSWTCPGTAWAASCWDRETGLREGSIVTRTGRPADVPVGEAMLGRVVDALGQPWTEWGPSAPQTRPIEHEASGVISREPVNTPLQTGILAIDAMIPIGGDSVSCSSATARRARPPLRWTPSSTRKGGRDLHLCGHWTEGVLGGPGAGYAPEAWSHGLLHHCVGHRQRPGPLQYIAPYSGAAMGSILCPRGRMCSSSMTI